MTATAAHRHVVVMGVAGTGKTTIGMEIAAALGSTFVEGDSFHSRANVEKMASGTPLDDDDRRPWLAALAAEIVRLDREGQTSVTACSALKRRYRDWLRAGYPGLFFLHLHGDYDTLLRRMEGRQHYMPPSLLRSQFDTLEPLEPDELGAVVDDGPPIPDVVAASLAALGRE